MIGADEFTVTLLDDHVRVDCTDCFWRQDFDRFEHVEDILTTVEAHHEDCEG